MSMPIAKGDLLGGYGLAFAAVAAVQASITSGWSPSACSGWIRPGRSGPWC